MNAPDRSPAFSPAPGAGAPGHSGGARALPGFHRFNGRRLFALQLLPAGPCRGAVLYLPPFVEEMNRVRSHAASQARALAGAGWRVMLLDPWGTGESDGELEDGDWALWHEDACAAARWLAADSGQPLLLWGARTGAMLAAEAARTLAAEGPAPRQLWWQPVLDGKLFLTQYLRLRIASQLVKEQDRETTEGLRARLAQGDVIEVAGYPLTGRLAAGLDPRRLAALQPPPGARVDWLEIVAKPEQALPPVAAKLAETWRAEGIALHSRTVVAPPIWQLQEREDAPTLAPATLALLDAPVGAPA